MKVKFEKGEQVRINEGPFANFTGAVDDVNEDRQTLKVMVSIFGRSTPVEIEFSKVDKVDRVASLTGLRVWQYNIEQQARAISSRSSPPLEE